MDQPIGAGHDQEEVGLYKPDAAAMPTVAAQPTPAPQSEPAATAQQAGSPVITWTASEYIENQKPANWYTLLGLGALGIAVLIWLLTRDVFPAVAVFIGVILLGVYGSRKPRQESYTLDNFGITIGSRHYAYHEFRSFKTIPDGAFVSLELAPLKRFAVGMTLFFDPADEDKIVDRLSTYLPMEEGARSLTDTVMRHIRF